jgi:DNA repair protein RecO (recombination protein O)
VPSPTTDRAIVLRCWDFSETSQTAALLTRGMGVVRCLAKGAKRDKSPYSGGLEPLAMGDAQLIIKSGDAMALLTAWDLTEPCFAARRSLAAHHTGLLLIDAVYHVITDAEAHPRLFDELAAALRTLGDPDPGRRGLAALRCLWTLLVEAGYRPRLNADARTGRSLPAGARAFGFDPLAGGLVRDPGPRAATAAPWRVRARTVDLLRAIDEDRRPAGEDDGDDPDSGEDAALAHDAKRAAALLAAYVEHLVGRELPARAVLAKLASPSDQPMRRDS